MPGSGTDDAAPRGGGICPAEARPLVLYNPAKMKVERYRFRGAQISTPCNIDEAGPGGARYCQASHDDVRFVGQVSELMA